MLRHALPLTGLVVLLGCSSGNQQGPAAPTETAQPAAATPPPAGATAAAPAAAPAPKGDPKTADDCKAIAASSKGDDPSANTAQATGSSDRSTAMGDLMKQKRPGFRCCFDIWADKIPEAKLYTKVGLVLEIDPSGKLKKATPQPVEGGPMVAAEV